MAYRDIRTEGVKSRNASGFPRGETTLAVGGCNDESGSFFGKHVKIVSCREFSPYRTIVRSRTSSPLMILITRLGRGDGSGQSVGSCHFHIKLLHYPLN